MKWQRIEDLRIDHDLTQQQVADMVGISLRSYKSYENDQDKEGTLKYNYILDKLNTINPIDEEHGILDLEYMCLERFHLTLQVFMK